MDGGTSERGGNNERMNCEKFCCRLQALLEWIGLGDIIPAFVCIGRSLLSLRTVFVVLMIWLLVISVAALHLFMGVLEYKCVPTGPSPNKSNAGEVILDDEFFLESSTFCGFEPGSGHCPSDQTCTKVQEKNPEYTFRNFNNLGCSFLTTFRLSTLDFWEDVYFPLLLTKGHLSVWFIAVTLGGSLCFWALFLSVILKKYASQQKPEDKKGLNFWTKDPDQQEVVNSSVARQGYFSRLTDLLCQWNCCSCWRIFSDKLKKFTFNPYFEIATAVIVMISIFALCMYHDNMEVEIVKIGMPLELFFRFFFVLEAILKILALSPKGYFSVSWHIFEFIVAVLGFLDLVFEFAFGLVIASRMLRILRLGRYWPILNFQFSGLGRSFKTQLQFMVLYGIIFTFVAWIGYELFASGYSSYPDGVPRWNFVDLLHSFMLVFRMLCAEWVESLYDCLICNGYKCLPYFFVVVFLGRYLLVNVFFAFMVGTMESSKVQYKSKDRTIDDIGKALDQVLDVCQSQVQQICGSKFCGYSKDGAERVTLQADEDLSGTVLESVVCEKNGIVQQHSRGALESPPECWPQDKFRFCCPNLEVAPAAWTSLRNLCLKVAQHWVFEVIILIIVSVGCIPISVHHLDSVRAGVGIVNSLKVISIFVPSVFVLEMIIKLFGYGFRHFFRSGWRTLDFLIVTIVFVNMVAFHDDSTYFRVFQSLQVLRLLRVTSFFIRYQPFRVVLNTLFGSVPGIMNLLLVVTMVWLVYSITANQLFGGKSYSCVDDEGLRLHPTEVRDRLECFNKNYTWIKHSLGFDNVIETAISLFQVGTFKGWIDILHSVADQQLIDYQPEKESSLHLCLYLFIFISHVTIYTLASLMSLLLSSLNQHCETNSKEDLHGTALYNRILQFIENKTVTAREAPTGQIRSFLHRMILSIPFRVVSANFALLGVVIMASYSTYISPEARYGLNCVYVVVLVVLFWELLARFLADSKPLHFICGPVNVLDLLAFILGVADVSSGGQVSFYVIAPPLLRLPRLAEIFWSFGVSRLFSSLRSVRLTLAHCLPHVLSVYLLVFFLILVYSLVGVNVFHTSNYTSDYSSFYNFDSLGHAMIVLFQLSTVAGWDGYYAALSNTEYCEDYEEMNFSSCGDPFFVPFFLISFVVMATIVFNLVPVLFIKYYKEASNEVRMGLAPDDFEEFYSLWSQHDANGQGFMLYRDLPNFLDSLSGSLRLAKPNSCHIATMDLPIYSGQHIYHREVLAALSRRTIVKWGYQIDQEGDLEKSVAATDLEVVSSTLWRAHEEKCVKVIQTAWKTYKQRTGPKI